MSLCRFFNSNNKYSPPKAEVFAKFNGAMCFQKSDAYLQWRWRKTVNNSLQLSHIRAYTNLINRSPLQFFKQIMGNRVMF